MATTISTLVHDSLNTILDDIKNIIIQYTKPYVLLSIATGNKIIHASEYQISEETPIPWVSHDYGSNPNKRNQFIGMAPQDNSLVVQYWDELYTINLQNVLSKGITEIKLQDYERIDKFHYDSNEQPYCDHLRVSWASLSVTLDRVGKFATTHEIMYSKYSKTFSAHAYSSKLYSVCDPSTSFEHNCSIKLHNDFAVELEVIDLQDTSKIFSSVMVPRWGGILLHAMYKGKKSHLFYSLNNITLARCCESSAIPFASHMQMLMVGDTLVIQHWMNDDPVGQIQSLDTCRNGIHKMLLGTIEWRPVNLPIDILPRSVTLSTLNFSV